VERDARRVSLAAALAIPAKIESGAPFPDRDLILWLVYSVIFVTLVVQGLTLPPLIRRLGVTEDPALERAAEVRGRRAVVEAAIARLDELANEDWVRSDTAARVRDQYAHRLRRFAQIDHEGDGTDVKARAEDARRLNRELLDAQRGAVPTLHVQGNLSDEITRRIEHELDLEHERFE
jgi:CPA1 family monovalent cation:H+ antiporter